MGWLTLFNYLTLRDKHSWWNVHSTLRRIDKSVADGPDHLIQHHYRSFRSDHFPEFEVCTFFSDGIGHRLITFHWNCIKRGSQINIHSYILLILLSYQKVSSRFPSFLAAGSANLWQRPRQRTHSVLPRWCRVLWPSRETKNIQAIIDEQSRPEGQKAGIFSVAFVERLTKEGRRHRIRWVNPVSL